MAQDYVPPRRYEVAHIQDGNGNGDKIFLRFAASSEPTISEEMAEMILVHASNEATRELLEQTINRVSGKE